MTYIFFCHERKAHLSQMHPQTLVYHHILHSRNQIVLIKQNGVKRCKHLVHYSKYHKNKKITEKKKSEFKENEKWSRE